MSLFGSFTHRRKTYLVERVEDTDALVLKVVFILRGPRGESYGLIPTADHPDRFFAVNARGFLRRTPFDGALFNIQDGRLVIEGEG